MKRMMTLLSCLLVIALLAGCGGQPNTIASTTSATNTADGGPDDGMLVRNVDELLSSIGPDREIVMAEGTYDLSDAFNYGKETESDYYSWMDTYDGYELVLHGVKNLTIRGGGKAATILSAEPRYANVLVLQNCSDVVLEDFTAGHTEEHGECSGGVLRVEGCTGIGMRGLGLYGCGSIGLLADVSSDIRLTDSDIYDCSSEGISVSSSRSVTVDNCRFYELGNKEFGGYTVFDLNQSNKVEITNCRISDNNVTYLMTDFQSKNVTLKNNQFSDNLVMSAAFEIGMDTEGPVLEGSTFAGNTIHNWYLYDGFAYSPATDAGGKVLTEEVLDELYAESRQIPTAGERTEVHVSTVDELLAAIAPDTEIVLDAEMYDLSTASGYGETTGEYYYWQDNFDGPGLVIYNVNNLAIRSSDGKVKAHTISAVPRYADVLTFNKCSNIRVSGFTAGHTEEPGYCSGGVLMFRASDGIQVDNCGLFGCGILGVQAEYCSSVQVTDCDIYECSYGGIQMRDTQDVTIEGCTFRDLGGDKLMFYGCKNVAVDGKTVEDGSYN